jgi:hypothetical protein
LPRKSKYNIPGSAVQPSESETPEPIRPQITQMFAPDIDAVIAAAPESTNATATETPVGPNGRKLRKDGTERAAKKSRKGTVVPDGDEPMSDPRYRQAIAGMNFYGAPRVIKRGFKTVSVLANDSELDLQPEENDAIDNYFYAVSKHATFDPMSNIFGRILLLILLIGEIVGSRILMRSAFGSQLAEMLKPKEEGANVNEAAITEMQSDGSIRSGSKRENPFD